MEDSQHEDGKFIASVPKAELHIHIEGTIEPDLLLRMADRNEINLPYKTPEDVLKLQILKKADSTENLTNFLECLDISRSVLCQAEDYYDMAMNFLRKCRDENIVYSEVMFDPQQGMRQGVIFEESVEALMQAQKEGLATYGVETQWIMCFQRDHSAHEAMGILSLADSYREFIVGVGLDNAEINGFPDLFKDVFQKARSQGYHLTSHCDVNQPNTISHIHGCIEILGVNRIDHGLNIAQDKALTETVISRDISLTGCPTFYISENSCPPERMDMIKKLFQAGVKISLNSDDPAQFGSGWLTQTLCAAQQAGNFSRKEMIRFLENAFSSAWLPEDRKTKYLNSLKEYSEISRENIR